ncbi:MAG: hypothetical protein U9O96_02650 [Candidatus Thermoplasmatota archaeon]|nr:hypothetical protein [Candidatus Thermoplasmatota archaeon]
MHGVKRERILRVLMNDSDGSLTKYKVAKLSECSISWAIEFMQNLERDGYIKGTKVVKPEALLEYWASIARKSIHYEFFIQSPTELLQNIDLEYVLTTYLAENLLNHYLFPARIDIYIHKTDLHTWKERVSKNGLFGKGNLRMLLYDEHVFYKKRRVDSLWVASIPQVLVDLKIEGGVCEEAYEMMVKKYVRKKGD